MPKHQEHTPPPRDDQSQGGAAHHGKPSGEGSPNKPAGAGGQGSVEGIGGTGGASGAGATRVPTGDLGEAPSGDLGEMIETNGGTDTEDVHETASGYRRSTSGNSGMPGQTRGPSHETIPDAEDDRDKAPPDNRKKSRSS